VVKVAVREIECSGDENFSQTMQNGHTLTALFVAFRVCPLHLLETQSMNGWLQARGQPFLYRGRRQLLVTGQESWLGVEICW
jgi:hypothetical protein